MAAAMVSGGAALLLQSTPIADAAPREGDAAGHGVVHARSGHDRARAPAASICTRRARWRRCRCRRCSAACRRRRSAAARSARPASRSRSPGAKLDQAAADSRLRVFGLIDARRACSAGVPAAPRDHDAGADHLGRDQHVDRRPADHLGRSDSSTRRASRSSGAIRSSTRPASRSSGAIRSTTRAASRSSGAIPTRAAATRSSGATARAGDGRSDRVVGAGVRRLDLYVAVITALGAVDRRRVGISAAGDPAHGRMVCSSRVLALVAGRFPLQIPGINAWFSVSDTFFVTSALLFGPAPATVTIAIDSLVMSYGTAAITTATACCSTAARPRIAFWCGAARCSSDSAASARCSARLCHADTLVLPLALLAAVYLPAELRPDGGCRRRCRSSNRAARRVASPLSRCCRSTTSRRRRRRSS